MSQFQESSYKAHQDGRKFEGKAVDSVMNKQSVDYWRHERMYNTLLTLLKNYPNAKWLTVGDGNFGKDANFILSHGGDALATDLNNPSFEKALEVGFIKKYQLENAERLSFKDDEFDFSLCKEAYHHFPRPYIALYEMLRTSKNAIVFIEPNDQDTISLPDMTLGNGFFWFLRTTIKSVKNLLRKPVKPALDYSAFYEPAGNFIFTLNYHELKKVAIGLNLPTIAWKGFNDTFIDGAGEEMLSDHGPIYRKTYAFMRSHEKKVRLGYFFPTMITFIIFKTAPSAACLQSMKEDGFVVETLPKNPILS
ncbi:MAG: methyltransferase domain-containing protein [Bacteroidia bacterium]